MVSILVECIGDSLARRSGKLDSNTRSLFPAVARALTMWKSETSVSMAEDRN